MQECQIVANNYGLNVTEVQTSVVSTFDTSLKTFHFFSPVQKASLLAYLKVVSWKN
jgi:hypothetical protein